MESAAGILTSAGQINTEQGVFVCKARVVYVDRRGIMLVETITLLGVYRARLGRIDLLLSRGCSQAGLTCRGCAPY